MRFYHLLTLLLLAALFTPALAVQNGDIPVNTVDSARRMITDLKDTYGEKYPKGEEFLKRLKLIEEHLAEGTDNTAAQEKLAALIREASLANPLLNFDELLIIRRKGEANRKLNSHTNSGIKVKGWDNDISAISQFTTGKPKQRTVYKHPNDSVMKHIVLDWDAERIMFSGAGENGKWAVLDVDKNGKNLRELTPSDQKNVDWFDSCYLAEEDAIITASTAGIQGLPCENGGKPMTNLYKVNTKNKAVRQLTFEQDSNWHPVALQNGRVMYLRWEYTDTMHYFNRILFQMNPDGTGQMELWGSGSYFPTAYCWPKQCPDNPNMYVGTLSAHHGKSETGRLLLLNPSLSRKYPFVFNPPTKIWGKEKSRINIHPEVFPAEKTGCVQEIPGWGRDVVGNVVDGMGGGQKYTFGTPWPLSSKYFLVSMKGAPGIQNKKNSKKWNIVLVDIFDNMTVIYEDDEYDSFEPVPFVAKKKPPVIYDRTKKGEPATIFCTDVYGGRGLKGIPRGTVKKLRVFGYHYGYWGSGGHLSIGLQSGWDVKRILGEVPVEKDGSFCFNAPANTPLAIQPLDEEGAAVALMRSWMTAMPGERLACNGCHEDQNEVTENKMVEAARRSPSKIEPWFGPTRPFAFHTEIQKPVLEKYCVSCHNEEKKKSDPKTGKPIMPSFEQSTPNDWRKDNSYLNLSAFVHRGGPETDFDLRNAMEYHASTSLLVQMFKKGHHGVKLDDEAWRRLYCWIDLNVPHRGMWARADKEKLRLDLAKTYAGLLDNPEQEYRDALENLKKVEPVKPEKVAKAKPDGLTAKNFPFTPKPGKKMSLKLSDKVAMDLVEVPAGEFVMGSQAGYQDEAPRSVQKIAKPYYVGTTEVTNAQFKVFDPTHDTRYLDEDGKDQTTPGYIANHKDQPVARISWEQANAFCQWLSKKTGKKVRLPSEKEWEWAARAGSDKQFFYGDCNTDFSPWANLADAERIRTRTKYPGGSNLHSRLEYPKNYLFPLRDDRWTDNWFVVDYVAQCKPNAFGLFDIVGNVCEWTASDYAAYPYSDANNTASASKKKVVRGGSWCDRPKTAGSTTRQAYAPYQKVFNVGFRVVVEE